MNARNTEELVRKIFCYNSLTVKQFVVNIPADCRWLARAARRFVLMEQRQKDELKWARFHKECRNAKSGQTNQEIERMENNRLRKVKRENIPEYARGSWLWKTKQGKKVKTQ